MAGKRKLAPDGVVESEIQGIPQQRYPLMTVCPKDNPDYQMKIRAADFDPEKYDKVEDAKFDAPKRRKTTKQKRKATPDRESNDEAKEARRLELGSMTVDTLKGLDAYAEIEDPATRKDDIIDQILDVEWPEGNEE